MTRSDIITLAADLPREARARRHLERKAREATIEELREAVFWAGFAMALEQEMRSDG